MKVTIKQRACASIRLKAATYSPATLASQAQAEAGADNQSYMSPLRTKQHVDSRVGTSLQAYDPLLTNIAALTTSNGRLIKTTGVDTVALVTLTPFAETLLDDGDAATARTTLGAVSKAGDVLSGPLIITGGRTLLIGNSETYSLGLYYAPGTGSVFLGASNSVSAPDLIASNIFGVETLRVAHDGLITAPGQMRIGPQRSNGRNSFGAAGSQIALEAYSPDAAKTGPIVEISAGRAASAGFQGMMIYSGLSGSGNVLFNLNGDGNAYADGSWTGGGADYAEYFEWADGNPEAEDRVGRSVVLDGEKIRPATIDDDPAVIIGVISAMPSVVGDAAFNHWNGRYERDAFGRYVLEDYEVASWTEIVEEKPATSTAPAVTRAVPHSHATDEMPEGVTAPEDAVVTTQQRRATNPAYDHGLPYVPREQRPEWSPVGLMGKLRLRAGEPVGARWLKLRDITPDVADWLVR